jgi:hypothetical protein
MPQRAAARLTGPRFRSESRALPHDPSLTPSPTAGKRHHPRRKSVREEAAPPTSRWLLDAAACAVFLLLGCCDTDRTHSTPDVGDRSSEASTPVRGDGDAGLGAPKPRPVVGTYCRADADCGAPFTCLTASSDAILTAHGSGGPSGGLCTTRCDVRSDACSPAENSTECIELAPGKRYCLPSCTPGGAGPALGEKCLGRLDLACSPPREAGQTGFCLPTCGGDFECEGRTCDLGSGACVDQTPAGIGMGGDCAVGACGNGTCEPLGIFQACTGFCTVGTVGCGFDPLSKGRLDSSCLIAAASSGSQADVGLCAQLCDCNDDCRHPRFVCAEGPPGNPASLSVRGHRGACLPPSFTQPGGERGILCARAAASSVPRSDP